MKRLSLPCRLSSQHIYPSLALTMKASCGCGTFAYINDKKRISPLLPPDCLSLKDRLSGNGALVKEGNTRRLRGTRRRMAMSLVICWRCELAFGNDGVEEEKAGEAKTGSAQDRRLAGEGI